MGTVRLVKTKGDKYVVFKCVKKDQIVKKKSKKHIDGEKQVLNTLNNVFCIKLFGTFQDKHYLYFALEFAAGGELCHHLGERVDVCACFACAISGVLCIYTGQKLVHKRLE